MKPDRERDYDVQCFVSEFKKQIEFINTEYDNDQHGDLISIISYGTFYVNNCQRKNMRVKDLIEMLHYKSGGNNAAQVSQPAGRGGRGRSNRGSRSRGSRSSKADCYPSKPKYNPLLLRGYIPASDEMLDKLHLFLKQNNFVNKSEFPECEYPVTIKMSTDNKKNASRWDHSS